MDLGSIQIWLFCGVTLSSKALNGRLQELSHPRYPSDFIFIAPCRWRRHPCSPPPSFTRNRGRTPAPMPRCALLNP